MWFWLYISATFIPKTDSELLPCGPAPDDISRKESPSQQTTTSYGNPMLVVSWQKSRGGGSNNKDESKRKTSNSLAMLPKRLRLGSRMMHLFGEACFVHRGRVMENPFELPSHPERVCIYTTPRWPYAGRPRQTNPSQTRGDSRGTLRHPAGGKASHHCGLILLR